MSSSHQRIVTLAAASLLGLMAVLMFTSVWDDTPTSDDNVALISGYSYLRKREYRLEPQNPPLIKDLAAVPLLFMKLHEPWDRQEWEEGDDPGLGQVFLYHSGNDPDAILRAARAPMILFTLAFGWVLFWWARNEFGDSVALLSLFLYTFSPTFLAHGRLVATDLGATAGAFIGVAALLRFFKIPTNGNTALTGVAMGFAFLTKFSTVALIPIALILAAAWIFASLKPRRPAFLRWRKGADGMFLVAFRAPDTQRVTALLRLLARTVGVIAIAYLVIYPIYLHHVWNYAPELQLKQAKLHRELYDLHGSAKDMVLWASDKRVVRPWAEYFLGLLVALQASKWGQPSFFLGKVHPTGSRLYFPFVYLIKEPLALHLLTLFAIIFAVYTAMHTLLSRARRRAPEAARFDVPEQAVAEPSGTSTVHAALAAGSPRAMLSTGQGGPGAEVPNVSQFEPWRAWLVEHFTAFAFLLAIGIYWAALIRSNMNIGERHLLPALPFTFILVACQIMAFYGRIKASAVARLGFRLVLGGLLAWQAFTVLRVHPSYVAYFNEIAGGPDGGWRYVNDSNLDWGQDVRRLAQFVEQHNIPGIHVEYFGPADAAFYLGARYQGAVGCSQPQQGWIAVSATIYPGAPWNPDCDYRHWLPLNQRVTTIGHSIFVFYNP